MINDTRLWHSSTPNNTDVPRRLVWVVFKTRAQDVTSWQHLQNTPAFIERQTSPTRRRLVGRR